jgi:hypothetical protein
MKSLSLMTGVLALAASIAAPAAAQTTINFSSLETVLVNPMDMNNKMTALWTGWGTQVYEYNMPFIELRNASNSPFAVETFRMTIGDTDYKFSNIFAQKENTNSYPFAANGEYAITGFSTPTIDFETFIELSGDQLVVDFSERGGLQPGEVVRFQVDIDRDVAGVGKMYADFPSVFFTPNGGSDTSGNSVVTLSYVGTDQTTTNTLPNFAMSDATTGFLTTPRPYSIMQPIDVFPDTPIGFPEIPEPAAGLMAMTAMAALAARRRG